MSSCGPAFTSVEGVFSFCRAFVPQFSASRRTCTVVIRYEAAEFQPACLWPMSYGSSWGQVGGVSGPGPGVRILLQVSRRLWDTVSSDVICLTLKPHSGFWLLVRRGCK